MGDSSGEPEDTMRDRAGRSAVTVWLLLGADRWVVTGLLSLGLWLAIVVVGAAHPTPAHDLLARGDPVETLYQALVAATVTGVTLVLTLSQLVLSQELGAVGDQRDRMEGAMRFRSEVADVLDTVATPAEPSAFLRSLVDATGERAAAARRAVDREPVADAVTDLLDPLLDSTEHNADAVADGLVDAEFGTYEVLGAALDFNYSWKLYAGRRILAEHGDALPDAARTELQGLVDLLELFGPAREHVKTLYFQWELSNLSLAMLVVAVPALAVAIVTLAFFQPDQFPGSTLGLNHALVVLATTTTLSLVPFAILLAYILRIVTVAKRTLSIGPFILRETDRDVDVDWD